MRYEYVNYNKYNINTIYEAFEKESREDFFRICKALKITVNPYPGKHKYTLEVEQLDKWLETKLNYDELKRWKNILEESDYINMLYKDLYSEPNYLKANLIGSEEELSSFLISTEYILSSIIELQKGPSDFAEKTIELKFEAEEILTDQGERLCYYEELFDNFCIKIKNVLEYIMFYKKSHNICERVGVANVINSSAHFGSIMKKTWLDFILESWQFGDIDIKKEEDTIIFANDYWGNVLRVYYEVIERNSIMTLALSLHGLSDELDTQKLDIKSTSYVLKKQLYVDDLNCVGMIEREGKSKSYNIDDWVKSFARLKSICKEHLEQRNLQGVSGEISQVCLKINKTNLEKQLFQIGVKDVSDVLALMTYTKHRDIIDAPLIEYENNYYVIPSLVVNTSIAQTVLSMTNVFEFRGKQLEEKLLKILKKQDIICGNIKEYDNSDTYQCDCIFVVESSMFIVEAKAWGLPNNITQYYNMNKKIIEAEKQIERLHDYIKRNLSSVLKKLGLPSDYKIENIYNILLSNFHKADNQNLDNVYMCDFNSFERMIQGRESGIASLKCKEGIFCLSRRPKKDLKITEELILSCLKKRKILEISHGLLEEKEIHESINKLYIKKTELVRKIGLFFTEEECRYI